jgi:NADH-quinone oxidoreductase subunit N
MDDHSLYFIGLLTVLTGAVALLSYAYLEQAGECHADHHVLMAVALAGAAATVASSHLASLFLGLEVMSVSLYALIAYPRARVVAVEAAIKYLVMAAATAAFMLLGIAFIYSVAGSLSLADVAYPVTSGDGWARAFYVGGLILFLTGVGFKLAVVPFHMWTADVYQGASAPVAAFVATVSKGAVIALLVRYVAEIVPGGRGPFTLVLTIIAVASMIVGNVLALLQSDVKRLLGYSSISHLGYLLVALLVGGAAGRAAVAFYLTAYGVAMVGAFGVIASLADGGEEPERLEAYRGLGRTRPWLGGLMTLALLSLAGIPITAGFLGKFFIVAAGAGAARWMLIIVLVLTSAVGLFYYLWVVIVMYAEADGPVRAPAGGGRGKRLVTVVLAALALAIVFLGLYPQPLLQLIQGATSLVGGTG